ELVRDADFSNDDTVAILLDTYHDRRNAFRFIVNPLGTQQDALITDEGRDINITWNGAWVSAGRIDDKVVFSTLAQRVGEKTQKRHRPSHKKPGRRRKSGG